MKLGAFLRLSFVVIFGFTLGTLFQVVAFAEDGQNLLSGQLVAQNNLIQNFEQATASNVVITDGRPFADEGRLEVQKEPLQPQRKLFPVNYDKTKEIQHDD